MRPLPAEVECYKRTQTFSQATTPKGFLSEHATKPSVWGKLTVETGQLMLVITEPGEAEEVIVTPEAPAVIAPEQKHHIRFVDDSTTFYLEFLK